MSCISTFSKYIIFIFNFIIAVCAIILITFGIIYLVNEGNGISIFDSFSIGGFAIGVGVIIFLIAFFGCCGAIKENSCLLTIYAIILIALFVIQAVLGILAFVKVEDSAGIRDTIHDLMVDLFGKTDKSSVSTQDTIQTTFKCCGARGPIDYPEKYPKSCCHNEVDPCYKPYDLGCAKAFTNVIEDNVRVIAYVAVIFAVVELVGAMLAFMIRKKRKGEYV